ncbi:MAG TPA: hypothetical protein VMH06_00575, partial [Thermodesulfovibrionales bacterium]|nr:hypothetical protein [Thermodesulfovibrionales bacterium]
RVCRPPVLGAKGIGEDLTEDFEFIHQARNNHKELRSNTRFRMRLLGLHSLEHPLSGQSILSQSGEGQAFGGCQDFCGKMSDASSKQRDQSNHASPLEDHLWF